MQRSGHAPKRADAEDHAPPGRLPSDPWSDREHVPSQAGADAGAHEDRAGAERLPLTRRQSPGPRLDLGPLIDLLALLAVAALLACPPS